MGNIFLVKRGGAIIRFKGIEVLLPPARCVLYPCFPDALPEFVDDGNGKINWSLGALYLVSIMPFPLNELGIVKEDEELRLHNLMEVSQPGKIMGLMNRDEHIKAPACGR